MAELPESSPESTTDTPISTSPAPAAGDAAEQPVKRKRGRPRKNPVDAAAPAAPAKRTRGPKAAKTAVPESPAAPATAPDAPAPAASASEDHREQPPAESAAAPAPAPAQPVRRVAPTPRDQPAEWIPGESPLAKKAAEAVPPAPPSAAPPAASHPAPAASVPPSDDPFPPKPASEPRAPFAPFAAKRQQFQFPPRPQNAFQPKKKRLNNFDLRMLNRTERSMFNAQNGAAPNDSSRSGLPEISIPEFQRMDIAHLLAFARNVGLPEGAVASLRPHELVFEDLKVHVRRGGLVRAEGVLEIGHDGTGFLRSPAASFLPCPEDACVLQILIERFGLRNGDRVGGPVRLPRDQKERCFVLANVETLNGVALPTAEVRRVPHFDTYGAAPPSRRVNLELMGDNYAARLLSLVAPQGFGQRTLVVAPPRSGCTSLLTRAADAVAAAHPSARLFYVELDGRPEDPPRLQKADSAGVFRTTFDEPLSRSVQVLDLALDMARRAAEQHQDAVLFVDNLTTYVRACAQLPLFGAPKGTLVGEANALVRARRLLAAAHDLPSEAGGSLTIVAAIRPGEAGVDSAESRIAANLLSTSNSLVFLDAAAAAAGVHPAIDLLRSRTLREETLLDADERQRTNVMRRALVGMGVADATAMILRRLSNVQTNVEFLMSLRDNV